MHDKWQLLSHIYAWMFSRSLDSRTCAVIFQTAFRQLFVAGYTSQSSYTGERQYSLSVCQSSRYRQVDWLKCVAAMDYIGDHDVIHDHVTWPDVTPSMNRDYRNPAFALGISLCDAARTSTQPSGLRCLVIFSTPSIETCGSNRWFSEGIQPLYKINATNYMHAIDMLKSCLSDGCNALLGCMRDLKWFTRLVHFPCMGLREACTLWVKQFRIIAHLIASSRYITRVFKANL